MLVKFLGDCIFVILMTLIIGGIFSVPISFFVILNKWPKWAKEKLIRIAEAQLEEELANRDFVVSKSIAVPYYDGARFLNSRYYTNFLVDDENKKFAIFDYAKGYPCRFEEINYSDLINFSLYENGELQIDGGGTLSATGAMMFGTAGAVVGSSMGQHSTNVCNELSVKIQVNDLENPLITIDCSVNTVNGDRGYRESRRIAEDIIATLTYIANNK